MTIAVLGRPDTSSLTVDVNAEFAAIMDSLTRRGLIGGGLALATGVGLVGCSGNSDSEPTAAPGWTFTDDRKITVRLAQRPQRIAFLTDTVGAALWAAGVRPVAATDSGGGIVDAVQMSMSGIAEIYSADHGVDLEKLAAAKPDLLVDAVQADGALQVTADNKQVGKIAPVIGIDMYAPVASIAGVADRLATALGTRRTDADAEKRYRRASAELRSTAAGRTDLRVAFVFTLGADGIGVMNPHTWAVLKTVAAAGVTLTPVAAGDDNLYSQVISWEKVPDIAADYFVWATPDPLPTKPIWKQAPAVRAGQVWKPDLASWYAYSWDNFGGLLDGLAKQLASAKAGIGPR